MPDPCNSCLSLESKQKKKAHGNVTILFDLKQEQFKKCLGEANSASPQQVLCHGSVQGACSASEVGPSPVKPRGG